MTTRTLEMDGVTGSAKSNKKLRGKNGSAKKRRKVLAEGDLEQRKIQFVLDKRASKTVDRLKRETSASNRSEIIRRAIALYKVFVDEDAQGIVDGKGDFVRVVGL